MEEGAPGNGGRKEELDLGLRQPEGRLAFPEEPGQESERRRARPRRRRGGSRPCAPGGAAEQAAGRRARPHEEHREVRGADEEADHVPRLAEAKELSSRGIPQHPLRGEEREGQGRGRCAHDPPVTRRKISSSDASPPAFARISSSVPRSTAFPRERIEDAGADLLDERQEMRRHDDGGSGRGPAHDRLFHLPDAARVDAGQRLVEDEDLGVVEEAAGHDELLLHAPGQLRGQRPLLARQLQLVEEGARAGSGVRPHAVQAPGEGEVVLDRQVLEEARLVRHEREAAPRFDGLRARSNPAILIVPAFGGRIPARHRSVVVLPAPFGPTSPSTSPRATRKLRPSTAVRLWYALTRPSTSITGGSLARPRNAAPPAPRYTSRHMPRLTLQTAGESHGPLLTGLVTGLPAGLRSTSPR